MLWRCNWVKQRNKVLDALVCTWIRTQISPKPKETPRASSIHTQISTKSKEVSASRLRLPPEPLSHDDVYSRLRKSPCDLNTLKFFFWCANQYNYFHDHRAFHHMVGVVEKLTREYKSIDRIIEELKRSGCEIKPRVFLLLLEIFWRGRLYDKAIEVYSGMSGFRYVPNTRALNMMMDVNFSVDVVHGALEIFQGIPVRNFFSFDIALCHLCRRGDLDMVKIVLMTMIREGFYPNTKRFGQILGVFCRTGRAVEGFQVMGLMISCGISVSVNVWSMLISGFFRSGEPQKAVDLYKKIIQIGVSPNLVTYTSFIKGFIDIRMDDEALSVLSTVISTGLAPDIVLCNVMIQTFTRLGRYEDAHQVFASLEKWKLVADSYTFSSIVSSLCLSRDFHLFSSITDGIATELDLVTGNSLLNFFSKGRDACNALKLVSHMSKIDLPLDSYTYTGYLTALCLGGSPREAIRTYEEMIEQKFHLNACVHTALIDSLIERGEYRTAIDLFYRCLEEKFPVDVVSYTVAIKGLVHAKRTNEACSLLCRMKESGVMPNGWTYRTIISGMCKEKENEKVKKILWQCINEGVELDLTTKRHVFDLLSKSHTDFLEFRSVFEKWKENVDVCDSCDELSVSVG